MQAGHAEKILTGYMKGVGIRFSSSPDLVSFGGHCGAQQAQGAGSAMAGLRLGAVEPGRALTFADEALDHGGCLALLPSRPCCVPQV